MDWKQIEETTPGSGRRPPTPSVPESDMPKPEADSPLRDNYQQVFENMFKDMMLVEQGMSRLWYILYTTQ